MGDTARELFQYRDVLYTLVWREIKIRYKQSVLGAMWALLMPLVIVLAGVVVRFASASLSGTTLVASDIVSVAVKSVPFAFFIASIRFGTNSLIGNGNLLTKVYLPRLIFPLAAGDLAGLRLRDRLRGSGHSCPRHRGRRLNPAALAADTIPSVVCVGLGHRCFALGGESVLSRREILGRGDVDVCRLLCPGIL